MSVKAINWALELPIPPTPKLVLVVLADYADDRGYAFPGVATIARRASVSDRTLTRVLADLESNGYIIRERRHLSNGNRTSDGYMLNPDETTRQNGGLTSRQIEGDKPPTVAPVEEPPVEPPVLPKGRATRLPQGWAPSNAHAMLAQSLKVDLDFEAEKFKDWVAANGVTKHDWEATFRNWLRTAAGFSRQRPDSPRASRDEEIRRVMQDSLGLDEQREISR